MYDPHQANYVHVPCSCGLTGGCEVCNPPTTLTYTVITACSRCGCSECACAPGAVGWWVSGGWWERGPDGFSFVPDRAEAHIDAPRIIKRSARGGGFRSARKP